MFTTERQMLRNVSPKTLIWYRASYRAFEPYLGPLAVNQDIRSAVKAGIIGLGARLSPVSINGHVRCLNCFFNWLYTENYLKDRLKFGKLKEPESLPKTLPDKDIDILLAYKPTHGQEKTAHVIALAILAWALARSYPGLLSRTDSSEPASWP
jgi:site-specific recombinase XerD